MTNPIAERRLYLKTERGDIEIPVRIFAPEQESDGAWKCRFTIGWPEGELERTGHGADSMQALVIAMQMIGALLYTSDHHKSGKLWSAEPGSSYGFPVTSNIRDLLEGDDKKFF